MDLTGTVRFGPLSREQTIEVFKDGRALARFIEYSLPVWFPQLKFVDGRGYDHIFIDNEKKRVECKICTGNGVCFAPSNMTGKGRKINKEKFHKLAAELIYVFCDSVDFPMLRVVFKTGKELIKEYPMGRIPLKHREKLFCR